MRRHSKYSCELCCCLVAGYIWLDWPSHQLAEVTQNRGSLKHTQVKKKDFLCSQVNHPLSAPFMNRGEEIRGEGRKWLLKRVSDQAQAGFCGSGSGTLLPSLWFQRALGIRCVYFPQLAHFTSNRSQSQHNLLIDSEGRSAESSLSSHWLASISF